MKQMFSKEELQAVSKEVADTEIDENLIANPTLEGDEETLSSIGIKGTNYAVGGGSEVHLYQHLIKTERWIRFYILSASATPITTDILKSDYQGIYLAEDMDANARITNAGITVTASAITYRYVDSSGILATGSTTVTEDIITQIL